MLDRGARLPMLARSTVEPVGCVRLAKAVRAPACRMLVTRRSRRKDLLAIFDSCSFCFGIAATVPVRAM